MESDDGLFPLLYCLNSQLRTGFNSEVSLAHLAVVRCGHILFYRSLPHSPYKELAGKGLIRMSAMFAVLLSVGRCAPSTFRVYLRSKVNELRDDIEVLPVVQCAFKLSPECFVFENVPTGGNAWFPTSIKALQSDRHRIKLTVLYETLCKDCAQFFQQVIYPKIWALGKDFIDLELIPYGNAIRSNDDGTQVITCQHGSFECTMNKLHSCLLYELKGATVAMPAIMCLFQNEHITSNITELFNLCAEKESFSKKARDTVFNCFTGYRGITLEEWMALRTESMRPEKHLFVPWIAINDLSYLWYQQYQPILLETLCHMQTNRIKPNSCQTIA
ncbi:GILT-like protein F37H8.5 [Trichinella sp. T8]|nr:GILT-like protein F37H8.5 [Trichinella sp. T8]